MKLNKTFINQHSEQTYKNYLAAIKTRRLTKRIFDLTVVLLLSPFWAPVFLTIALLVKLTSKGPIFYTSKRIGLNGVEFDFYKFRSMKMNADKLKDQLMEKNESKDGVIFKMKNDPRVTAIGRIIRKTSMDELPQLLNVLKGDMSLVGPRPPIANEVNQYKLHQYRRLQCAPGITCIWQISGRSTIPFEQQVQLDLQYMRESNFLTDLRILILTVPAVLKGEGAY